MVQKLFSHRILLVPLVFSAVAAGAVLVPFNHWNMLFHFFDVAVARQTGHFLDLTGILHLREGAEIRLLRASLEASDIRWSLCSPIFYLIALALFLAWNRAAMVRTLLTAMTAGSMCAIPAIVVFTTATLVRAYDGPELHVLALNMLGAGVAAALIASANSLVSFACGTATVPVEEATPIVDRWNRYIAGAYRAPMNTDELDVEEVEGEDQDEQLDSILLFPLQWYHTRKRLRLAGGVPTLVTLAAVALLWIAPLKEATISERYQIAAEHAVRTSDYSAAEVCYERLAQRDGWHSAAKLELARLSNLRGDRHAARVAMEELAESDADEQAEAHLWLAKDLRERAGELTTAQKEQLRQHLEQVVRALPEDIVAREMLAEWFLAAGQLARAVPSLKMIVDKRPEMCFLLADGLIQTDQPAEAEAYLARASSRFGELVTADPGDATARANWGRAELRLGNLEKAHALLSHELAATDVRCQALLANCVLLQVKQMLLSQQPDWEQALQHVKRALEIRPRDPAILTQMSAWAVAYPEMRDEIRDWFEALAESDDETWAARFVLGNIAWTNQNFDQAIRNYERAHELQPDNAAVMNNLAFALSQHRKDQLPRALGLMEKTAEVGISTPKNAAEAQIARGLILLEAQQWEDAILHLEKALPIISDREAVHRGLATAYRALGFADVANSYLRRARELADTLAPVVQ